MEKYEVKRADKPVRGCVEVPGSKSVTNRALFMAAMARGKSVLRGTLFSDDSRHFIGSLKALGYDVVVDEDRNDRCGKRRNGCTVFDSHACTFRRRICD